MLELLANAFNVVSIVLAGRNNIHTWWTGIVGCTLFGWLFMSTQLYADALLQVFFVATSVWGWRNWYRPRGAELRIRSSPPSQLAIFLVLGLAVAAGHAWVLQRFTDAFAPWVDSSILVFSVLGQLLLTARRIETWGCWLVVNSLAVPLYATRGLYLTAVLYGVFWLNACISLRHWYMALRAGSAEAAAPQARGELP